MNVYDELIKRVSAGSRFKIDFNTRTLKVGKRILINKGVVADGYEVNPASANPFEEIEAAYESYYYSRPSERSEAKRRLYFKAMRFDDMSDEQLICGTPREVERAKLEFAVLRNIIGGWKWKEEYGSWYWKSNKFSNLIILKDWIKGE